MTTMVNSSSLASLHPLQFKILNLAKTANLADLGLRKLANLVGETHPQKIKYHLQQLAAAGYVKLDETESRIVDVLQSNGPEIWEVFNLPIMGMANCGPATMIAEQKVEGYIQVSPKIIGRKHSEGLFAIRAVGNSLNKAEKVKGGPIKDGDYVIVDSTKRDPDNGEYVLSVIGGVANLKRFYKDSKSKIIKLMSESTTKIPPICIHFDDFEDYMVNGVVLMSIKG